MSCYCTCELHINRSNKYVYPNNEVAYDQILSPQKVKHHRVFGKPIGDEKKRGEK